MTELEVSGFQIVPELSAEVDTEALEAAMQKIEWTGKFELPSIPPTIVDYRGPSRFDLCLWWMLVASAVYLLVLLVYYIFYKLEKNKNPLRLIFRKTRPLWVVLMIAPVISFVLVRILL